MNHDEARELLLDHREGTLDADHEALVAAHLADCADCNELLETYDVLAVACAAQQADGDHPSTERLVECAEDPSAADDTFERHVASCDRCTAQLQAVRDAASEAAGAIPFRRPSREASVSRWRRSTYAAAAVAALLVMAVGWLALVRVPGTESRLAELRQRISSAPGSGATVSLPVFRGSLRGGETPPTIVVGPDDTLVPLALTPSLPGDLGDAARQRLELRSADGTTVYSSELDAGEIRRLAAGSGAMAWLVPVALLGEGEYALILTDLDRHGVVLDQSFRVERRQEGEGE